MRIEAVGKARMAEKEEVQPTLWNQGDLKDIQPPWD